MNTHRGSTLYEMTYLNMIPLVLYESPHKKILGEAMSKFCVAFYIWDGTGFDRKIIINQINDLISNSDRLAAAYEVQEALKVDGGINNIKKIINCFLGSDL